MLRTSLVLAFERTRQEPLNLDSMIHDLLSEFTNVKDSDFKSAIRNGSLGRYGITYRLSTQEVCKWVRQELENGVNSTSRNTTGINDIKKQIEQWEQETDKREI